MDELKKLLENAGVAEAEGGWDSGRYEEGPLTPDDDPDLSPAGITDSEYDAAITSLAKLAIWRVEKYYGDEGNVVNIGPNDEMLETTIAAINSDIKDTIHHIKRLERK